jgi:hypothetical protein
MDTRKIGLPMAIRHLCPFREKGIDIEGRNDVFKLTLS